MGTTFYGEVRDTLYNDYTYLIPTCLKTRRNYYKLSQSVDQLSKWKNRFVISNLFFCFL